MEPIVVVGLVALLVPVQWWLYRGYRRVTADPASRRSPLPTLACGALLLAGYLHLIVVLWRELSSWPTVGSLATPFLVLFGCGATYQSALLLFFALRRSLPLARTTARVLAVAGGIAIAASLGAAAQQAALRSVVAKHADLLRVLATSAAPCDDYRRFVEDQSDPRRTPRSLHLGKGRVVMTFAAGSADMDGSTLVLDSDRKEPWLFHNDDATEREALSAQQGQLSACAGAAAASPPPP